MSNPVTVELLKIATFDLSMHRRFGRGGCAYLYGCREFPRFVIKKSREKAPMPVVRKMYVDDLECATLADVAAALNGAARACRVCGCTQDRACDDPETGTGCHWIEADLCSACKGKAVAA